MRRYYLSPVVGDGSLSNPYRAQIADEPETSVAAVISTDANGQPTSAWALCLVAAQSHGQLARDNRFGPLPDMLFDARMSALSGSAKAALDAALLKFGVAATVQNEGYREFVRSLGRLVDPAFDENALGVADR